MQVVVYVKLNLYSMHVSSLANILKVQNPKIIPLSCEDTQYYRSKVIFPIQNMPQWIGQSVH